MRWRLILTLLTGVCSTNAQVRYAPDTLLIQRFEVDPTDTMLLFPSGNDLQWVNWDADQVPPACDFGRVPGNWFWDSDLGDSTNSAFTSCSYLKDAQKRNENWLITPPIFISDTQTILSWRSLSFEGPAFLDGYKVLISTTSNAAYDGTFQDTLFVAAEMIAALVPFSLDPKDYVFSAGYIHASGFRDTTYFIPADSNYPNNRGLMEPHAVSLTPYAGKRIYIAFVHDSQDDNILQLDDIAVVQGVGLYAPEQYRPTLRLRVLPNPARDATRLFFSEIIRPVRVQITDATGRAVSVQSLSGQPTDSLWLDMSALPSGTYVVAIVAEHAVESIRIVRY